MARVIKYRLRPVSFYGHLFASDTVFGALAWAVRSMFGEVRLEEMLCAFAGSPPFLVSSAMPDGFLPRPLAPQRMHTASEGVSRKELSDSIARAKRYKKVRYVPAEILARHLASFDDERVFGSGDLPWAGAVEQMEFVQTRTAIDRTRLSALEGALFAESYNYMEEGAALAVYARTLDEAYSESWLDGLFDFAAASGFGKNRSTGKGVFDVERVPLSEDEVRIFGYEGGLFMSISLCAGNNLSPVRYATATKYAKIGGEFSQSGIGGKLIVNKNPIVFYREGSLFRPGESPAGMMVRNVHPDPRIVQYGYAFPVGITLGFSRGTP